MTKCIKFIKNPVFHLIIFFIIYFMLCLAFSMRNDVIDVDLWSRLIMGKHVFETGTVMKTDIVSYTPTHVWYDHEWLSSTLFYIISTYFGPLGITLFKTLSMFLVFLMINFVIEQNQGTKYYKYKYAYLLATAGIFFHIALFDKLRCQHITFIFFPLFIYLLERVRNNPKSRAIWFLPFIMLIWLNSHGGAVVGLGMILIYAIGEFISKRPSKHLFIAFLISALVWLINPWGIDFIKFMFDALTLKRQWIAEWQPPSTLAPRQWHIYLGLNIFIWITYIYSTIRNKIKLKDINYSKLIMLIILTYLGFKYIKHASIYLIGVFSYMYADFKTVFDDILYLVKKYLRIEFALYPLYMLIALIYAFYVFDNFSITDTYYRNTIADNIPAKPLQFLKDNNLKGNIFAPYYFSGYIAYKEYPDLKIYIDGREEQVWDNKLFRRQMKFLFYTNQGTESVLEKYKPDIILIEHDWFANEYLQKMQNYYKLIYADDKYFVYVSPALYKMKYKVPDNIRDYSKKNLFKTKLDFKKK